MHLVETLKRTFKINLIYFFWKVIKPEDDPEKYAVEKDGMKRRLIVNNVTMKDEGLYSCKVLDKVTTADLFVERKFCPFLKLFFN